MFKQCYNIRNGNQITKTSDGKTETNTYDGLNQLIGFTDGETTASYKYNASGLRYEKTVNGETVNHVWNGSKQIVVDVIDNQFYEADCYKGANQVSKTRFAPFSCFNMNLVKVYNFNSDFL